MPLRKDLDVVGKKTFIRLLAHEANFTLKDTAILWNSVEKVLTKCLLAGKTVIIPGFGKLYILDIPAHRAWDGIRHEYFEQGPTKRITFSMTYSYRDLIERYGGGDEEDYESFEASTEEDDEENSEELNE